MTSQFEIKKKDILRNINKGMFVGYKIIHDIKEKTIRNMFKLLLISSNNVEKSIYS